MEVAATLAASLRSNSRTMMKLSGEKLTVEESLLALIYDKISILVWQNTEDAKHGRNLPHSIYKMLTEEPEKCEGFESGADFMEKWRSL